MSSAPPLTLFSQHYWSVLSRPHRQHRHVHIQIYYLVIRKQSLDLITEMKAREKKTRVTPRWAASKMDFNLADCCHEGYEKGLGNMFECCFCFVLVSCVTRQSFVFCGKETMLESADIAHRFPAAARWINALTRWNSLRTFKSFVAPSTCLCCTQKARFSKICWPVLLCKVELCFVWVV